MAVIRKLMGWTVPDILEEYYGYAADKPREQDIKYITDFEISSLDRLESGLGQNFTAVTGGATSPALKSKRMFILILITMIVLLVWFTTLIQYPN